MPVAFVQEADAAASSVSLGAGTTAGNTVIVAVACLGPTSAAGVAGVTLGGSPDNFTLITPGPSAQDTTSPNDFLNVTVWADANCLSGATAIAVTGTGIQAVWAFEFSGLAGMADVAQVFPVAAYQDSWMAATAQTTVPAEAWIAVTAAANQTASPVPAVNSDGGWTLEAAYSGTAGSYDWGALSGYQTVNTVGIPSLTGSFSQASFSVTVLVTLGAGTPPVPAVANAPLTGNVTVRNGDMNVHGDVAAGGIVTQGGTPVALKPVGPKTGNYTASPGDFVLVSCSTGAVTVTVTLPAAPANGALVGVKLINSVSGTFAVQASGSDVIDAVPAGTTTIFPSRPVVGTTFVLQYQTATATWYTQSTGTALVAPALNSPQPSDAGYVSWSYDYTALSGTFTGVALTTGGKVTMVQCPVRAPANVTEVSYWITAAGSGLTSGQNFAGIYSSTGNLICTSGDTTSQWGGTGLVNSNFAGAPFTISPPFVWAAFLCNGTTGPSFAVTGNQTAAWANGRQAGAFARFGVSSAGGHASLPSSISPVGGIALAAAEYWAGLSL